MLNHRFHSVLDLFNLLTVFSLLIICYVNSVLEDRIGTMVIPISSNPISSNPIWSTKI